MGNLKTNFPKHDVVGKVKLKNKAVFFSIVSVLIIVLFMTLTRLSSDISSKETEIEITRTRIKVLNSLIKNMEETYFEKMIYVAGKNSLYGLSKYYSEDWRRIEKSLFKAMEDTIDDGILLDKYGNPTNLTKLGYMKYDYTTNALIKNVTALFEDMGLDVINLEINLSTGNISQREPWHIIVEADVIYDLRDKNKIVSWRGSTTKKVNISVLGIYAYDYEGDTILNKNKINSEWVVDEGPHYSEPSLLTKLSEYRLNLNQVGITSSKEHGKGLCSPDFSVALASCGDDT